MIARSFDPGERAAALRWCAAGGIAVLPEVVGAVAGEGVPPAPWIDEDEAAFKGWTNRASAMSWDGGRLLKFAAAAWVNRAALIDRGTQNQRVELVGRPLRRAAQMCASGTVERSWGFEEGGKETATGRLLIKVCGLAPTRVRTRTAKGIWNGFNKRWVISRWVLAMYGPAVVSSAGAIGAFSSPALVSQHLLNGLAAQAATVDEVFLYAPGKPDFSAPGGYQKVLAGVGFRVRAGLCRALGAVAIEGTAVPTEAIWVATDVQRWYDRMDRDAYWKSFRARFARDPSQSEFEEAGLP